jgi:hypothetical protein
MNTNKQPYSELLGAIGKEETETEFHQQIEEMSTPNEQPQGVTPGEIAAKVWETVYHDRRPFIQIDAKAKDEWEIVVSTAISAYLAALPEGPSDGDIMRVYWTSRPAKADFTEFLTGLRALFAAHLAKELSEKHALVLEFEAMYDEAKEENEVLKARIAELEAGRNP